MPDASEALPVDLELVLSQLALLTEDQIFVFRVGAKLASYSLFVGSVYVLSYLVSIGERHKAPGLLEEGTL